MSFPQKPAKLTAEQIVRRAGRLAEFVSDEIVVNALATLKYENYQAFLKADSSEDRVRAWAKGAALEEFADELTRIRDAGEVEMEKANRAAKATPPAATNSTRNS